MKHLFIVNPIAGKGKALEYIPKIEEYFSTIKDIFFIQDNPDMLLSWLNSM